MMTHIMSQKTAKTVDFNVSKGSNLDSGGGFSDMQCQQLMKMIQTTM